MSTQPTRWAWCCSLKSSNELHAVNPLNSLDEYEAFIYGLPQQFSALVYSTLLVVRRGAGTALVVKEALNSSARDRM